MKLNDVQQKAVDTKGQNVLVFASAGGGKTTVLVTRLLKRILEDRIPLDRILAMTFTSAASLNMKKRLEKRLREKIVEFPDDHFLKEQLTKISTAHISTIHSFCLELIKEYYYVIGLSKTASDNILDEGNQELYLDEAFYDVIFHFEKVKELNQTLTSNLFSLDSLKAIVLDVLKKASACYDPYLWLEEKHSKPITCYEDLSEAIKKYYREDLDAYLHLARSRIEELAKLETKHQEAFQKKIIEVDEALKENDHSLLIQKLEMLMTSLPNEKDEKYKKYRKELQDIYTTIAKKLLDEKTIVKVHNDSLWVEHLLLDITKAVYTRYQEIKQEHQVIDFNDFEHYAYEILTKNDGEVAKKLKEQYQEIMIDEFQDTNDTQFKIVSLFMNDNLFLVGDIKQSIYRFRNGKPEIMRSLKERDDFLKIHIKNNYRSNTNIVDFNNLLFEKIMNLYDHDYDEEDLQITLPSQAENNVDVYFKVAKINGLSTKKAQAELLAHEILQRHREGKTFKDMAVLVKTHNEKKEIRSIFERYHIPYFIKDKEGYFQSLAIDILLSYFKLLQNKEDSASLIAVLSSPLYGLDDNALYLLKEQHENYAPFEEDYERLFKLALANEIDAIIYEILKINHFYEEHLDLQEKANIDLLLKSLDQYHVYTLQDVIRYIEKTSDFQKQGANTINEDADVVKVMTIHTSKGLEFDTVFLYSNHTNRQNEATSAVVLDDLLGLGLALPASMYKDVTPTITRKAILAKDNIEDLLEFERLLYVALTRSKKEMIILDALEPKKEISEYHYPLDISLLYARKGFTSLIYSALEEEPDFHYQEIAVLKEETPLPRDVILPKEIPHFSFKTKTQKEITPSGLEKGRIRLDFNAIEGMEYGTRIHEVFEKLNYSQTIDEEKIRSFDPTLSDSVVESILFFTSHPLLEEARTGEIHQEFSFFLKKEEGLIHGFMDFVAICKDKIILIDYKSDTVSEDAILIDRYHEQLLAYQDVLHNIYPSYHIETYIYSIHLKKFIPLTAVPVKQ